ncbi:MAG: RNA polymerase sigma factor [Firmicutes bacterium]|nr:RNA polymerase sigma factor [Bacillota bacterium]
MNAEEVLIKQAAAGDKAAFEQLVEKYKAYVLAIILQLIPDSFHAENVAQEVFLQMYISLPQYRFAGFRTWLGRMATRKAIDWKRKQRRIQEKEIFIPGNEQLPVQEGQDFVIEKLMRQEEAKQIRALCRQLPGRYQAVIEKYYFLGKSYRQIALEEKIAVKTVETRLYRARQKLKEKWEERNK